MRKRKHRIPHRIGSSGINMAFRRHWRHILMTSLFLLGLLVGVLTVRTYSGEFPQYITGLFDNYFSARNNQPFFTTLLNSFSSNILLFLTAFVSGLCIIGAPVTLFIAAFRGLGLGLTMAYLFSSFGMKGIAYSILLIVPAGLMSCISLIMACTGAFGFSSRLFSLVGKGNLRMFDFQNEFKLYCLRFGVFIVILLVSAIVDATLSAAFIGFFEGKLH